MSDQPTTTDGRESSNNERHSGRAEEGHGTDANGGADAKGGADASSGAGENSATDASSGGGENSAADESGGAGENSAADPGRRADRDRGVEQRPGTDAERDQEIVLTEGKTLSDYLEDEPEPKKTTERPEYRSVANVETMIVPPPAGLTRPRQGEEPGSHEGGPQQREEGREHGRPHSQEAGDRAEHGGEKPGRLPAGGNSPTTTAGTPPPPKAQSPDSTDGAARRAPIVDMKDDGDFGAMLDTSLKARSFETGETVRGVVVALGPEVAFLDIGGKSEATIDISELKDPEGDIEVEVGDTIEALVVSTEGGLKLSRRLARGAAAKEQLAQAFQAGLPVEGRVEKVIKGGFEIRIAGQRAFCPVSQIDTARTADPNVHVGKVHTFRIIEYKEGGKNLIVSRRVLLQEEEKEKAEETRKSIVPDAVMTGRIVSVRDYGAFVDLGGVQGLLHVSEIGWTRVSNAADVLKPGDEITVKVLRVDEDKGRISLGLKQLQPDPWSRVAESYVSGQVYDGKVVRIQDFGAFVELEPGIEALAHVSTFPPTGTSDGWKKAIPVGTTSRFEVLSVDPERKRIGVAMLEEGRSRSSNETQDASATPPRDTDAARVTQGREAGKSGAPQRLAIVPGARLKGKIERHENFGVFVFLAPGRTGLMPMSETGTQRGADLRKTFPVGSEVEVVVLEAEPSGKRIRLSRKALLDSEEKDDAREFAERRTTPESFGSIGDKLRAALASKKP